MNITEFQIDSFHRGGSLRFVDLGNGLNVALARSDESVLELLHVIPGTLFGSGSFFGQPTHEVLIPTRRTCLHLRTDEGAFTIERFWEPSQTQVRVTSGDQTELDQAAWAATLGPIMPNDYADRYTFDVRRLARLLQSPDHAVRVIESMAEELSRHGRLRRRKPKAPPSTPRRSGTLVTLQTQLASLRELMVQKHEALTAQPVRGPQDGPDGESLRTELKKAERDVEEARNQLRQLQEDLTQLQGMKALGLLLERMAELEQHTAKLDAQLQRKPRAVESSDADTRLGERLRSLKEELTQLRQERKELNEQIEAIDKQSKVRPLRPRIELLLAQEKSLSREEDAIEQLTHRIEDAESRVEAERFDTKSVASPFASDALAPQVLAKIETLADHLRDAERQRDLAEQRLAKAETLAMTASAARPTRAVAAIDPVQIHEAEERVAQLRERLGWTDDQRELLSRRSELENQVRRLYAEQLMPISSVIMLGIPFMIGVAMIIHAIVTRGDTLQWEQVLWGFLLAFAAAVFKWFRDRERFEQLNLVRDKLARVRGRLEQVGDVAGESSVMSAELEVAERELQALRQRFEEDRAAGIGTSSLVAASGGESVDQSRRGVQQAKDHFRELQQRWRELMVDLDLPVTTSPAQAPQALADKADKQRQRTSIPGPDAQWQVQALKQELERRQDWLGQFVGQLRGLVQELGHPSPNARVVDLAEVLRDALREDRDREQSRKQLQRAAQRLKQKEQTLRASGKQVQEQRDKLRAEARQRQEQESAERKLLSEQRRLLGEQQAALTREIDSTQTRFGIPRDQDFSGWRIEDADARIEAVKEQLATQAERLTGQSEARGRLRAELALAESARRTPSPTLDLEPAITKAREIETELQRVEGLAASGRSQNGGIRESSYLMDASRWLRRLSGAEYRELQYRMDRGLFARRRDGRWLPLERVDPQHYANIFFTLWLTRVEQQADQGVRFPLTMEDPLSVTPADRAATVAQILRECAAMGHQILLVSRHPRHIVTYEKLGVPIADLSKRERVVVPSATEIAPTESIDTDQGEVEPMLG